jgi:hypothetical protein
MRTYRFFPLVIVVSCALVTAGCKQKKAPVAESPQASITPSPIPAQPVVTNTEDAAKRDFSQIGAKAAAAVLAKDSKALLSYELDDSRVEDEATLKNPDDPLNCFLFNSECVEDPKGRSVYEILSGAKNLDIKASVIRSPVNNRLYGLLIFYDKSNVSEQQLLSEKFLCSDDALKKIASWHFEFSDGKWRSRTLFDHATEGLCSEQD